MSPIPLPDDLITRLVLDVDRAITFPAREEDVRHIGRTLREAVAALVRAGCERCYLEGYGAGLARAAQIQLDSGRALRELVDEAAK